MKYDRVRELREDSDLPQRTLAAYLQVTQKSYSRYETGEREPSLKTLCKIADFHNVSTDYLLNRTDRKELPSPVKKRK